MLNFFRKKLSVADQLLARMCAIKTGALKPELNKCGNCGKQLDTIALVPEELRVFKIYCDPCKKFLRAKELETAIHPRYNIDEILGHASSFEILDLIASRTESDSEHRSIPWDVLLPPEIVCRAFSVFDRYMRNGFADLLDHSGGLDMFIRGHRAIEVVGVTEALEVTTAAKQIMENHGIAFPDHIPQDWWLDDQPDWDVCEKMKPELDELDSQYSKISLKIYDRIADYVRDQLETLRTRNQPMPDERTHKVDAPPVPDP